MLHLDLDLKNGLLECKNSRNQTVPQQSDFHIEITESEYYLKMSSHHMMLIQLLHLA